MIELHNCKNPYSEVADIVLSQFYDGMSESIIVNLRQKYSYEKEYEDLTLLLQNDGEDWLNPDYNWEWDWNEGQQDIQIVGAVPVGQAIVPAEFFITENKRNKGEA